MIRIIHTRDDKENAQTTEELVTNSTDDEEPSDIRAGGS